jgi:hypothetical protein
MSNFVGNKPTPLSILLSGAKKIFKPQKTTGTGVISSVDIAKNLTKKKNIKDNLIKSRDKLLSGVRDEAKVEIKSKNPLSKFTKKIEKIVDKKAKGGRVGLKRGTNLQKIKKTFGANKKTLGMQSVIYGLDKNPKITAADPKAKFIAAANKKKKKKVV